MTIAATVAEIPDVDAANKENETSKLDIVSTVVLVIRFVDHMDQISPQHETDTR